MALVVDTPACGHLRPAKTAALIHRELGDRTQAAEGFRASVEARSPLALLCSLTPVFD